MKTKMDLPLWLVVGGLVLYLFNGQRPAATAERPTAAGLATIFESFAYNVERDGQQEPPVLQWSNQLGEAVNEFGARSTLGRSYRSEFSHEFQTLGRDLKAAMGVGDAPVELTAEKRAAAVNVFRLHVEKLRGEL